MRWDVAGAVYHTKFTILPSYLLHTEILNAIKTKCIQPIFLFVSTSNVQNLVVEWHDQGVTLGDKDREQESLHLNTMTSDCADVILGTLLLHTLP